MNINSISDFRRAVRSGPWAWPGGYPCYWIMADGEACAFDVAKSERRQMLASLVDPSLRDGWRPIALEINWEGDLYCAHTGERIPSAYAEPEDEPEGEPAQNGANDMNARPVPANSLAEAFAHIAAGGVLIVPTYTHVTRIDAKVVANFAKAGEWLLKAEGKGYRLRKGKGSVYLFPGQLRFA